MATDLPKTTEADGQYKSYWVDDDSVMIYDVDNLAAHICSDVTLPVVL